MCSLCDFFTMSKSILTYFKPVGNRNGEQQVKLPDPTGPLTEELPSSVISTANKDIIESSKIESSTKTKGPYAKFTPEFKAKIAKYAIENGNCAAARKFSAPVDKPINESSVRFWVVAYKKELRRKRRIGEALPDVQVLPECKKGGPLLLGEKLDCKVKSYVRAVREVGGPVTTTIVLSAGRAVVIHYDPQLLSINGGPLVLTATWAKSLLYRMCYVKRKGCIEKKIQVQDFEGIKAQFLTDIKAVVTLEDIPDQLILNWDHTGINVVPTSSWTMEEKGRRKVEIVALDDKRQLTAVVCGTLHGDVLPVQLIYQGKTAACLPKISFPHGWLLSYTPNYWSNEEKTCEYIDSESVILPYLKQKRKELGLNESFPALALFDVFKGQTTESIYQLLEDNHVYVVNIPANCTHKLQPMDLSVNKSKKDHLKKQLIEWYSSRVYNDKGNAEPTPVDLRLSIMRPLNARWIVSAYNHLKENTKVVINGFKEAGITQILES